ncbi:MAG: hypothetical protein ACT4PK_07070, partial [Gammaproteobacteria bacterium]
MRRSNIAGLALGLLLAAPAATAASLCDGPCSVSIDFAEGGTINATDGAVLTFGPENGLLALGAGGSIDYGAGGGFVPLEGGLPDMSQGGTITLGPGGIINFGPGGSLATGIGGVTANG